MISVTFVLIDHVMKKDQQCQSGLKSKMHNGTLRNTENYILSSDDCCFINGKHSFSYHLSNPIVQISNSELNISLLFFFVFFALLFTLVQ